MNILSQCLDTVKIWMATTGFKWTPARLTLDFEDDWFFCHLWCWMRMFQTDPVCNLLDSQLLPSGQVARKAFVQLCLMHQLCLFLNWRPYLHSLMLQSPHNWTTAMCSKWNCPWRLLRSFSWYRMPWHEELNALLKQCMLYPCSVRCISCPLVSWSNLRWTLTQI